MAEKTVISIEVEGTGKAINSIKELKAELKAAQSAALNGDGKAAKRVAELKDKMDDLTDSTKSLQGSGVERITSGFDLLGQGFKDFDFDKIKTGFKGLGSAMSAIPIFLLIEGIMLLVENFQDVIKFFGIGVTESDRLTAALERQKKVNEGLFSVQENAIAIMKAEGASMKDVLEATEKLNAAKIKAAKDDIELQKLKIKEVFLNDSITESLQRTAASVLRAQGNSRDADKLDAKINADKLKRASEFGDQIRTDLITINKLETENRIASIEGDKAKNEKSKERLATNLEAIKKIEDAQIAAIKNEELRLISAEVKANERRIKEIKDGKESAELKRQELEAQAVLYEQNISKINADAAAKRKAEEDKIAADKKAEDEKKLKALEDEKKKQLLLEQRDLKANNELKLLAAGDDVIKQLEAKKAALATQRDIELSNTELTESEKAAIKAKYAKASADLDKGFETDKQRAAFEIAQQSLQATQNLTDIFFNYKISKAKKGSKEEEDLARKQFNINKALQIGLATIDGFKAISASLALSPVAIGPAPNPAGIASLAFVAISTAATIAKIASSQFKGGGGGGGGGETPTVGSPSIPSGNGTPSIAAPQQNTTTFTGNNNNNFNQPPIKTYVVETDLRNSTNTIDKIKDQATF
jgi:hypothetical protein